MDKGLIWIIISAVFEGLLVGIGIYRPLVVGPENNFLNCRVLRAQIACKKLKISLCGMFVSIVHHQI